MVSTRQRLGDVIGGIRNIFRPKTKPSDVPSGPQTQLDTSGRTVSVPLTTALDIADQQRTFSGGGGGGSGGGGGVSGQRVITIPKVDPKLASQEKARQKQQAEVRKQQRTDIQSRTLSGQVSGEIQPTGHSFAPPTRGELGAERNIFKRFGSDALSDFRRTFNIATSKDTLRQTFDLTGGSASLAAAASTGTTIGLGLPEQSPKTIVELKREEFIAGGLTVPATFEQEMIGRSISSRAETELRGEFDILQSGVSTGALTIGQAEKQLELKQESLQAGVEKEFQTQQEKIFQKRGRAESLIGLRDIEAPSGFEQVKSAVIIGAFLAGPATGGLSTAAIAGVGLAEFFSAVKEETALQKGLTAGGGALIAFGGAGSTFTSAARAVDIATLESLVGKKGVVLGEEVIKGPKGSLFKLTGVKKISEATLTVEQRLPIFKTGPDKFSITGGTGKAELEFFSLEQKGLVTLKEVVGVQAKVRISQDIPKLISKGLTQELPKAQGGFGTGVIIRGGKLETFNFGGISAPTERAGVREIITGNLAKLRTTTKLVKGNILDIKTQDFSIISEGIGEGGIRTGLFRTTGRGFIKSFTGPSEGVSFVTPAKIIKTPLSKTFQVQQTQQLEGALGGLTIKSLESSTKALIKQLPKSSGVSQIRTASVFAGTGQFERFSPSELIFATPKAGPVIDSGLGTNIFEGTQPTGKIGGGLGGGRIGDLGSLSGRLGDTSLEGVGSRGRSKGVSITGTLKISSFKLFEGTTLLPRQLLSQTSALKLSTKQLQKSQLSFEPPPSSFFPEVTPRGFVGDGFGFVPFALLPPLPTFGGGRVPSRGRKKRKQRIAPSLTGEFLAQTQDIFGELPKEFGSLGILPGQIRLARKRPRNGLIKVIKTKGKKKKGKRSNRNQFFQKLDF